MSDDSSGALDKKRRESLDLLERALSYRLIDIEEFSMRSRKVVDASTLGELEVCLNGLENTPKIPLADTEEFENLKARNEKFHNIDALIVLATTVVFLIWWLATDFPHPWISIIVGALASVVVSEVLKYDPKDDELIETVTKKESKDLAQNILEARRIRRELEQ